MGFNSAGLEVTKDHVHIDFSKPVEILSSAILNGGFTKASNIVNMKIPQNKSTDSSNKFPSPETTIEKYIESKNGRENLWA